MDWQNAPIGTIRRDELLNALLAIWKTRHSLNTRRHSSEFYEPYELGFEEGLDAIAQMAGLIEEFEAGKAFHRAKIKAKLETRIEIIDSPATLLDSN